MANKKTSLKEYFKNEVEYNKQQKNNCIDEFDDKNTQAILLRNFNGTMAFLSSSATEEELAIAITVLDKVVGYLSKEQAQKLIGVFEQKLIKYPNIDAFCPVDYADKIKSAKKVVETGVKVVDKIKTPWKEQSLQVFFEKQLEERQEIKDTSEGCGDYCDSDEIEFMLLRVFDDTVNFLKSARKQIVALAIWGLEDIAYKLSKEQVQILIDIFKQKKIEFPDIADYCDADYDEEIAIAEDIINGE